MVKRILLCFCLMITLGGATCSAGLHDYPTVAVLDFGLKANASPDVIFEETAILTDAVTEMLINSDRFNIVDRSQIEAVLAEQANGMSGLYDPATAARVGGLLGAEYIVTGNVNGLSTKETGVHYDNSRVGGVGNDKHTVTASVSVRVIEVATGRVVLMSSGRGSSSSTNSEFELAKKTHRRTGSIDVYGRGGSHGRIQAESSRTSGNWQTLRIGSYDISQEQVGNALVKAAYAAILDEQRGLIAKLDGKGKKKSSYKDYLH